MFRDRSPAVSAASDDDSVAKVELVQAEQVRVAAVPLAAPKVEAKLPHTLSSLRGRD